MKSLPVPVLIFVLVIMVVLASCGSERKGEEPDIRAIRTVQLHSLEKIPLKGKAALFSGWTLDDLTEVTMLYEGEKKPCGIDTSKEALLVKYRIIRNDGLPVFAWELQPNSSAAGCMMKFASFRGENESAGHDE
jgi:hypothetical protein